MTELTDIAKREILMMQIDAEVARGFEIGTRDRIAYAVLQARKIIIESTKGVGIPLTITKRDPSFEEWKAENRVRDTLAGRGLTEDEIDAVRGPWPTTHPEEMMDEPFYIVDTDGNERPLEPPHPPIEPEPVHNEPAPIHQDPLAPPPTLPDLVEASKICTGPLTVDWLEAIRQMALAGLRNTCVDVQYPRDVVPGPHGELSPHDMRLELRVAARTVHVSEMIDVAGPVLAVNELVMVGKAVHAAHKVGLLDGVQSGRNEVRDHFRAAMGMVL